MKVGDTVRVRVGWSVFNGRRGVVVTLPLVDPVVSVKFACGLVVPFVANELEVEDLSLTDANNGAHG